MIGVVIPAHNEYALIEECLLAVHKASQHPLLAGEAVEVVVVLDGCTDGTYDVVSQHRVHCLTVSVLNVGVARATGAQSLLNRGARWLAFTDADTRVAPDWLVEQIALGADAVCGTVAVEDWSEHGEHALALEQHFQRTYSDKEGHRHVHGANFGVSAAAYLAVGGFAALASSEDVALVAALEKSGARVAWSAAPRVVTSARRHGRAPLGFAAALCAAVDAMRPRGLAESSNLTVLIKRCKSIGAG